jgi:DNA replication protein DnaC
MSAGQDRRDSLKLMLRTLKLPSFLAHHEEVAIRAEREGLSFSQFLHHLAEIELEERRVRRIQRLLRASKLPREKTLATLDMTRFSAKIRRQVPTLCEGGFVERAENVLAFGLPGRGKTHLLCAICHELSQRGYSVLFTPAFRLVQQLLVAKRDLELDRRLQRLDRLDVVVLDELGYVEQNRDEMEVLFTFLAERYERRSVMVTSNLVFSQWDKIFKDPVMTAAAIDRLVHHATILELDGPSFRTEQAKAQVDGADSVMRSESDDTGEK